jgi:hypothetical protein
MSPSRKALIAAARLKWSALPRLRSRRVALVGGAGVASDSAEGWLSTQASFRGIVHRGTGAACGIALVVVHRAWLLLRHGGQLTELVRAAASG